MNDDAELPPMNSKKINSKTAETMDIFTLLSIIWPLLPSFIISK